MPDVVADENARRCAVIYDGQCPFCRKRIAWIAARDRAGVFELLPRQTPGLTDRFPILAQPGFDTGMRFVMPDGSLRVGADAVYQVAMRLGRWRTVAWLYRVPGLNRLAKIVYAGIAKRRQSLAASCDDESGKVAPDRR